MLHQPIQNFITNYLPMVKRRALAGGGAGGAIAPPTFWDLFSKFWEFLKKKISLFTVAPPTSKCRRGPCPQILGFLPTAMAPCL